MASFGRQGSHLLGFGDAIFIGNCRMTDMSSASKRPPFPLLSSRKRLWGHAQSVRAPQGFLRDGAQV